VFGSGINDKLKDIIISNVRGQCKFTCVYNWVRVFDSFIGYIL